VRKGGQDRHLRDVAQPDDRVANRRRAPDQRHAGSYERACDDRPPLLLRLLLRLRPRRLELERFDEDDDFRRGTFAPFSRASLRPIAIACFRLFTRPPDPLFSVPFFRRCIADSTRFDAALPYFAMNASCRRQCKRRALD
jgi:hypothetical protein